MDQKTGQDFTHRRRWLRERLLKLANIFSIRLLAFAIMENHFHVVLHVDQHMADAWSDDDVIIRWHQIFKGSDLSQRHVKGETLDQTERKTLSANVLRWRKALNDISWFMRCAKEPLARQSNKEDGCKGRFWEGRFHSQTLLDTRAVIACMTYVDLNPTRAKMCDVPEADPFTSLHYRSRNVLNDNDGDDRLPAGLINLDHHDSNRQESEIPVSTVEYIELVDLVARQTRPDKKGRLSLQALSILQRLGIKKRSWQGLETCFNKHFHVLVGCSASIKKACQATGQKYAWGQQECHVFFS